MRLFDPKDSAEIVTLTFDFTKDLGVSEILTGPSIVTITVAKGIDATPSAMLSGAPQIIGSTVLQLATAGVAGNNYYITAICPTNQSHTLAVGGRLSVTPAAQQ